jgi:adenylate cyclase
LEFSKKDWHNLFIGILLTAFTAGLMLLELSPFETIEAKLFDYRMKLRGALTPPDNIVIAVIDEKSLERMGRWPWDRDTVAALVDKMSRSGAELIMFDVVFSEAEKNDPALARSIDNAGNVILPLVFGFDKKKAEEENPLLLNDAFKYVSNREVFERYVPIRAESVLMPVDEISRAAMALGHINMNADADGTLRWETMAVEFKRHLFPSIDLQVAAKYLGIPPEAVILTEHGIVLGKKRFVPTNLGGQNLINYYGGRNTFPYISLSDIYEGNLGPGQLEGKIILIGATAKGIFDLRVTPFSAELPGVEKHASVIASILENRLLRSAPPSTDRLILIISGLVFSFFISLLIMRFRIMGAFSLTGISLFLLLFCSYELFVRKGLWINVTYPALNFLLILTVTTAYDFVVEEKFARRIRGMFSSYVTEKVVDELIRNPDMARLGGERREITVLFSDVRGFTTFSEKHAPEEVITRLNEYLGEMTAVVLKWEGTLDKFVGDAILAFWGAPMRQEDHAERAVKCAIGMIAQLQELQKKWEAEGKTGLDIGIGINTGEVIVGNIGAEGKKMDYTVIGDHVNLGSRVESLTRKYNTHILITEFTFEKISAAVQSGGIGHVSIKGLEKVVVKGKEKPVAVYELASLAHGAASSVTGYAEGDAVYMKEK